MIAAAAWAFPDPTAREASVPWEGGSGRGTFEVDDRGLHLASAAAGGPQHWLADGDHADGLVRARVTLGEHPDFTLLFRASVDAADPFALRGYGVSVERDVILPLRYEGGGAQPLGASVPFERGERRALELVIQLTGPTFVATVWDADTLELVATVAASDGALPAGRVGWRVHPDQDAGTALAALAVLDAGSPAAPVPTPFGPGRWVEVDPATRARIPRGIGTLAVDEPEHVVVRTDPLGLEKLRRAGVGVRSASADEAFWMRDRRYRVARDHPEAVTLGSSYKSPEMVHQLLAGFAASHPDLARVEVLGRSWGGRPIEALHVSDQVGTAEDEPAVLLVAAHHGGELLSTEYALDAIRRVLDDRADPRVAGWIADLDLWFVPLVNPDGCHAYLEVSTDSDRKNGRDLDGDGVREPWEGVDLNRNYPFAWGALGERASSSVPADGKYRGPAQASEPETRAIVALADRLSPVAVISWHTAATKILAPYTVDGKTSPAPDATRPIAQALAAAAGTQPSGRPFQVVRNLYPVDGTDQDWHRWAHGSAAYIVEGSHHNPLDVDVIARSLRSARPVFETLLDRVVAGPRLVVHATDRKGEPVEAVVTLAELTLSEGEQWRTRPGDGRFDLLLAAPGPVTVTVAAPGFQPFEREVDVAGVTEVRAELRPAREE